VCYFRSLILFNGVRIETYQKYSVGIVDIKELTYCDIAKGHQFHGPYHDSEYGFPVEDESLLFERLTLEIFQAGLSWLIVLKKRQALNIAFKNFDVDSVARFNQGDIDKLKNDKTIIRNKLKIESTIYNANSILSIRQSHETFAKWLFELSPLSKEEWCRVFKKKFKFIGGEIVGEFLMSIGYLKGAHHEKCPIYKKVKVLNPEWGRVEINKL